MTEPINPCPLCGHEAGLVFNPRCGSNFVICRNWDCGIQLQAGICMRDGHIETEAELVARWNALPRKEVATGSLVLAVPQWTSREVREQYEQLSAEADRIAATFQRELEGALAPYHSRMTRMVEVGTAPTILVKR